MIVLASSLHHLLLIFTSGVKLVVEDILQLLKLLKLRSL